MSAKLRRYATSFICALLCWALVAAPCVCMFGLEFASSDGAVSSAAGPVSTVPADRLSLPISVSDEVSVNSGVDESIQDMATSDKTLAGLESGSGSQQAPAKPAVPTVQQPQTPSAPQTPSGGGATVPPQTGEDVTYELLTQPNGKSFIYYEQTWPAYASHRYGYNTVGSHGCGPTSMAMVVSNLAGVTVSPSSMADWSFKNGFYVRGRGTAYGLFPAVSAAYGIKCSTISCYDKQAVVSALQSGKLLITVVGYGDFTVGRHFLLIRGITADGKLLLADSGKYENCLQEWDYNRVLNQVANSYFWVFEK